MRWQAVPCGGDAEACANLGVEVIQREGARNHLCCRHAQSIDSQIGVGRHEEHAQSRHATSQERRDVDAVDGRCDEVADQKVDSVVLAFEESNGLTLSLRRQDPVAHTGEQMSYRTEHGGLEVRGSRWGAARSSGEPVMSTGSRLATGSSLRNSWEALHARRLAAARAGRSVKLRGAAGAARLRCWRPENLEHLG